MEFRSLAIKKIAVFKNRLPLFASVAALLLVFGVFQNCASHNTIPSVDSATGTAPSPTPTPNSIKLINSSTITFTSSTTLRGLTNFVYDGVRLVAAAVGDSGFIGYPSNVVTFQNFSTSLNSLAASASTLAGITGGNEDGDILQTVASGISGQSSVLWQNGSNQYQLSARDDGTGTVSSTSTIIFSTYGCSDRPQLTYCAGNYYGSCTSSNNGNLRLFSFNSGMTMLSGIDTNYNSAVHGLTCLGNTDLILAGHLASDFLQYDYFYKFDLNFNLIQEDSANSYTLFGLNSVAGVTNDGNNLYFSDQAGWICPSFTCVLHLYKTSFGQLD